MPKHPPKHRGYLLKSGDIAQVTTGSHPQTIDLTGPSGYGGFTTPDMEHLRDIKDGLYSIVTTKTYSKIDDDWRMTIEDYDEIDPSDELRRLEKIVGTPLKAWKTKAPGVAGQIERQKFVGAGLRAKRERIQMLLYNLMRLLGRDPVEEARRRAEETSS
jgi:hypothetical protein